MRTGDGENVEALPILAPGRRAFIGVAAGSLLLLLLASLFLFAANVIAQDAGAARAAGSERQAQVAELYLPLVRGSVAGPPPALRNGDFENGADGAWLELSLGGWPIIQESELLPVVPHGGDWAAWLGGSVDEISYLEQRVTVPPGKPHVAYWRWIASVDACGYDEARIIVNGGHVVSAFDLCEETSTDGWQETTVDLTAYAGEIVLLQFRAETDGSLNSNLFIDDVRFAAEPVGAAR